MERILFIIKFPAETWKNIEDEMRETFQKILQDRTYSWRSW